MCVPRPARRDASVAGEPGATLDVLLSTAGEPGPRSIRLSSVASFSTCRARKTETVRAVERRLYGSRAEEKNIFSTGGKKEREENKSYSIVSVKVRKNGRIQGRHRLNKAR